MVSYHIVRVLEAEIVVEARSFILKIDPILYPVPVSDVFLSAMSFFSFLSPTDRRRWLSLPEPGSAWDFILLKSIFFIPSVNKCLPIGALLTFGVFPVLL